MQQHQDGIPVVILDGSHKGKVGCQVAEGKEGVGVVFEGDPIIYPYRRDEVRAILIPVRSRSVHSAPNSALPAF